MLNIKTTQSKKIWTDHPGTPDNWEQWITSSKHSEWLNNHKPVNNSTTQTEFLSLKTTPAQTKKQPKIFNPSQHQIEEDRKKARDQLKHYLSSVKKCTNVNYIDVDLLQIYDVLFTFEYKQFCAENNFTYRPLTRHNEDVSVMIMVYFLKKNPKVLRYRVATDWSVMYNVYNNPVDYKEYKQWCDDCKLPCLKPIEKSWSKSSEHMLTEQEHAVFTSETARDRFLEGTNQ